jgi:hypothetical protein
MTELHPARGRHGGRSSYGLMFWLVLADAALLVLRAIPGPANV